MPTIRVSDQTLSRIRDRAIPFEDREPEDVIRRLLDKTEADDSQFMSNGAQPTDLVTRGGRIPHGSDLRATYKGREYRARVDDGKIIWKGRSFESPSRAAVAVIQSTGSDRKAADGWRFWEVKTPESGEWRPARDLQSDKKEVIRELEQKLSELSEEEKMKLKEELEFLNEASEEGNSVESPALENESNFELLICKGRGARATGKYKGAEYNGTNEFIVFQGSIAASQATAAATRAENERRELKSKGILKSNRNNTGLVFTRDEVFTSPSAAARAVLGRSANGRTEWKTEGGRMLKEINSD